jgi:hypothetical protein
VNIEELRLTPQDLLDAADTAIRRKGDVGLQDYCDAATEKAIRGCIAALRSGHNVGTRAGILRVIADDWQQALDAEAVQQ